MLALVKRPVRRLTITPRVARYRYDCSTVHRPMVQQGARAVHDQRCQEP